MSNEHAANLSPRAHLKGHYSPLRDMSGSRAGHTLAARCLHGAGTLRLTLLGSGQFCLHLNSRGRQALASQRQQVCDAPVKQLLPKNSV
jgi:hypothetical protein